MRLRPALAALLLVFAGLATTALAGCGAGNAVPDQAVATNPDQETEDAYRLTVRSSQGATEAIRDSTCGSPSSQLVILPCGVSLGFARANAPRLNVWRTGDRLFLELGSSASAVFTSLGQGEGDRGITRRSAWTKLGGTGTRFSIKFGLSTSDFPRTVDPTYLSVLVIYDDDMPVPTPATAGTPADAVVHGATAEFVVQLAARTKSQIEGQPATTPDTATTTPTTATTPEATTTPSGGVAPAASTTPASTP